MSPVVLALSVFAVLVAPPIAIVLGAEHIDRAWPLDGESRATWLLHAYLTAALVLLTLVQMFLG